jgi:DNA-binding beta-propeller fold protein YncE
MTKILPLLAALAAGFAPAPISSAADAPSLQALQAIPLEGVEGRIDHLAVNPSAGRLYVAALGNNTVEVIDLAAGRRVDTIKGLEEVQGIVAIPELQRLVVASGGDGQCRIYDSSLRIVGQIGDLEDADNVRYDPQAGQAIVGFGHGALAFVDPQSGTKVGEIKLDGHPESFQLEARGARIFVNVPGAGEVAVVDRTRQAVVAKWPLSEAKGNFPMALDEADHRLFIGCRRPAKLLVLDTEAGGTVAVLDIVGGTDDIFYDRANRRIYVSGSKGGISVVQQTDADHYAALADVPTAPGAQTSLFVPGTGKLYVAIPHRGSQQAQIEVFSAPTPLVLKQTILLPQVAGGFNHHSADGKLRRVFLCATTAKTVEVLDLATGKIIRSLPGGKPSATCFAADLNVLCVSRGSSIQLYDAGSFEELAVLAMPSNIDEMRYDPRARQLVAGCMSASTEGIATIDLPGRKLLGCARTAQPQGFCLEEDGDRVFVCTPRTDQISVVDRRKSVAVDAWRLSDAAGNCPVAYDDATHRLLVGCRRPAELLVLNADNGKSVAIVPTGEGTDDLSFDSVNKRVYVACADGVISVIQQDDADHYRKIADVPSAPGARNCVFIPESGEFCVTAPQSKDQRQPAEVLIYQVQPTKR